MSLRTAVADRGRGEVTLWVNHVTFGAVWDFRFTPVRWGNRPGSLWIAEDFGCCASG